MLFCLTADAFAANVHRMSNLDPISPEDIRARAKGNGWTVERLCREAGIATTTFNRWRNGTTDEIGHKTFFRLAYLAEQKASETVGA